MLSADALSPRAAPPSKRRVGRALPRRLRCGRAYRPTEDSESCAATSSDSGSRAWARDAQMTDAASKTAIGASGSLAADMQ